LLARWRRSVLISGPALPVMLAQLYEFDRNKSLSVLKKAESEKFLAGACAMATTRRVPVAEECAA
jgi:hypothetical protein